MLEDKNICIKISGQESTKTQILFHDKIFKLWSCSGGHNFLLWQCQFFGHHKHNHHRNYILHFLVISCNTEGLFRDWWKPVPNFIPSSFSWGKQAALVHRKESLGLTNLGGGNFHLQAECLTEDNHSPAHHKVMDSGKAWLRNASGPQKGGQVWSPLSVGFFLWEPKGSWTGRLCLSWAGPGGYVESRGPRGFLQVPL